jgi:[ribosomal protein S5]-alanine N-acetyltransferase
MKPAVDAAVALLASAPGRLEADGVLLRAMREPDATILAAAFVADPDLGRLLGYEEDPTEPEVRARIARSGEPGRPVVEWAIADPQTETCLGSMLVHSLDARHRRAELGFYLVPGARGAGAGSRAVARAVRWLFEELALERVELTTTPDNTALRGLALGLGFIEEGTLRSRNLERGRRVDVVFFGLLRGEWQAR